MHDPKLNPIDQPVASLGGVGRDRLARLEKLGIRTIKDLLWYGPKRYEDRNRPHKIDKLEKGDIATVTGVIAAGGVKRMRGGRSMFEFILDDNYLYESWRLPLSGASWGGVLINNSIAYVPTMSGVLYAIDLS